MQCAEYTFIWWLRNTNVHIQHHHTYSMVTGMVVMQQNDGQSSLDAPGLQLRTLNVVCCFAAESDDFRVRNDVYYNGDSSYATNRKRKIVGRSQMNMLHDMLRTCVARSRYQNSYPALQVNVIMTYTRCHGDGELIGGSEMNMPHAMLLTGAAIYNNSYNSLGFHFATPWQRVSLVCVSLSVVSSSFTVNEDDFDELAAAAARLIDEAEQAHLTPPVQPAGYPYTARRQQQQRQRLRPQNVRFL